MVSQGTGLRAAAGLIAAAALVASAGGCASIRERWAALVIWAGTPPPRLQVRPDPRAVDNRYRIGRHLQDRGRHREAVREFDAALAVDPKCVKCLNARGASCDALGLFAEAARSYRAALRIAPDLDYLHNNLGYSLLLQGDREGAKMELERALALNPAGEVARNNLRMAGAAAAAPAGAASPPRATPAPSPAAEETGGLRRTAPANHPPAPSVTLEAPPAAPPPLPAPVPAPAISRVPPSAPAAAEPPAPAAPSRTAEAAVAAPGRPPRPGAAPAAPPEEGPYVVIPIPDASGATVGDVASPVRLRRVSVAQLRREQLVELAGAARASGLRDQVRSFLAGLGFRVVVVDAEDGRDRAKTLLLYREGALQPAYEVAKAFPGYQEMEKTERFASPEATVRVVLGRDMDARRAAFAAAGGP